MVGEGGNRVSGLDLRWIFIGGCDRSGTTMLGDLLASTESESVIVVPESHFIHEMIIYESLVGYRSLEEIKKYLEKSFRFSTWDMTPDDLKKDCYECNGLTGVISEIIKVYAEHKLGKALVGPVTVVDHTPDNMKNSFILDQFFEESRYIHIVRDGRAVFSSVKKLPWGPNVAMLGAKYWRERVFEGLTCESMMGARATRVYYEDLLSDAEGELRRLCDFSGIAYSENMIMGGSLKLPGFTRKQHEKIGREIDSSNAERWRSILNEREIRHFSCYAQADWLLYSLGYESSLVGVEATLIEKGMAYLANEAIKVVNYLKTALLESNNLRKNRREVH